MTAAEIAHIKPWEWAHLSVREQEELCEFCEEARRQAAIARG